MERHPCKSTETVVVWGRIKLATGEELEGRGRDDIRICGQETNQNMCQTKVTDFPTAVLLCLDTPLQHLYSLLVVEGG